MAGMKTDMAKAKLQRDMEMLILSFARWRRGTLTLVASYPAVSTFNALRKLMNRFNKLAAVALVAVVTIGGVMVAEAQSGGPSVLYDSLISRYPDAVRRLTPDDTSKLMAMSDKMMQAEMDYKVQMAKMEAQHQMDMAKMARDMEAFLIKYQGH